MKEWDKVCECCIRELDSISMNEREMMSIVLDMNIFGKVEFLGKV